MATGKKKKPAPAKARKRAQADHCEYLPPYPVKHRAHSQTGFLYTILSLHLSVVLYVPCPLDATGQALSAMLKMKENEEIIIEQEIVFETAGVTGKRSHSDTIKGMQCACVCVCHSAFFSIAYY